MPVFSYKAVDNKGTIVKGKFSAGSESDLENMLSGQGLIALEVKVDTERKNLFVFKPKLKDIILMCVQLEQLESAGVPLLKALEDIRDSADSPRLKELLSNVHENVKAGDSVSESFKKQGGVFDDFFVGLVAVGEKTGKLADIFGKLAAHYKWSMELRSKIKKALRYPLLMLVLMGGVISIMMVYVVPKMTDFLNNIGVPLPGYTVLLVDTSRFFVNYGIFVLAIIIGLFIGYGILYKTSEKFRLLADRVALKIPFIGPVILKINLSHYTHFFAVTFNSGLEVLGCVESGKKLVTNLVIRNAIDQMKEKIVSGRSIATSMQECGIFPNMVTRMFKVGEDSGNIEASLENVTHFYDKEVDSSIEIMVGAIQPTLIILVGGILAWIMLAVFGPLYSNLGNILKV